MISEFSQSGFGEDWYASCRDAWYRCNTREQGHRLIYACRRAAAPTDAAVVLTGDSAIEAGQVPGAPPVAAASAPEAGIGDAAAP